MIPKRGMSHIDVERAFSTLTGDYIFITLANGQRHKFSRESTTIESGLTTEGEIIRLSDPDEMVEIQLLVDSIDTIVSSNDEDYGEIDGSTMLLPSPLLVRNFDYPMDTKYLSCYNLFDVMGQQGLTVPDVRRVSGYCHLDLGDGKEISLKFNKIVDGLLKGTFPRFDTTTDSHVLIAFNFEEDHTGDLLTPVAKGTYKKYNATTFTDYNIKNVRWEYNYIQLGYSQHYVIRLQHMTNIPKEWSTGKVRLRYRLRNMLANEYISEDYTVQDAAAGIVMTTDLKLGYVGLVPDMLTIVPGHTQKTLHDIDMIDVKDLTLTWVYEPS